MDCGNVKRSLIAFLEAELSENDRSLVEAHLHHCEDCRKEKVLLASAWAALDGFHAPAVGHDFTAKLMAKIHGQEEKRPAWGIALPEIRIPFAFPRLTPVLVSMGLVAAVGLSALYLLPKETQPVKELSAYKKVEIPAEKTAAVEPGTPVARVPFSVPDEEIIRNLDVYENIDLLQNFALLSDFDLVQNPDVKVV